MRKNVSIIVLLMASLLANAKVWRVNNAPGISADFSTITAAYDAASSNDTLYIEGSSISYGALTLSKPLTIIGPGYFLQENPYAPVSKLTAKTGKIICVAGSAGTILEGLDIDAILYVQASNITVKRNLVNELDIDADEAKANLSNVVILQNYFQGGSNTIYFNTSYTYTYSNFLVANNYITGTSSAYNSTYGTVNNIVLKNNIFYGAIYSANSVFENNIQVYGSVSGTAVWSTNTLSNNISVAGNFGSSNGNLTALVADMFVGTTGTSTDGQWALKTGSPAKGAGKDGKDCGIFGGDTPYVLSGQPEIPNIYFLDVPTGATTGVQVKVGAKVNE